MPPVSLAESTLTWLPASIDGSVDILDTVVLREHRQGGVGSVF